MSLASVSGTGSSNPSPSSGQSVSRGISPSCIENPAVAAACGALAKRHSRQRRTGLVNATQLRLISLSGLIPVPQCRLDEVGLAM